MRHRRIVFVLLSFFSASFGCGQSLLFASDYFSEAEPLSYLRAQQGRTLLVPVDLLQKWATRSEARFPLDGGKRYYVEVIDKSNSTLRAGRRVSSPGNSEARGIFQEVEHERDGKSKGISNLQEYLIGLPFGTAVEFSPLKGRTSIPHGYWFCNFEDVVSFFIAENIEFSQTVRT